MGGFFAGDKDVTATDLLETREPSESRGEWGPASHSTEHRELMLQFSNIWLVSKQRQAWRIFVTATLRKNSRPSCRQLTSHSEVSSNASDWILDTTLPFRDMIRPRFIHCGGKKKSFCLLCNPELPRHLTPERAGCGVSDKPTTNHCFVSSHQCFEAWAASGEQVRMFS